MNRVCITAGLILAACPVGIAVVCGLLQLTIHY